jgi:hypothetical protein
MKNLLVLALLTFSGMAAAQRYTCEVDMVDIRTNRLVQTFSIPGVSDCFEAKKACAKERRLSGRLNTADCIEYGESNHRPGQGNGNGNGQGNGNGNGQGNGNGNGQGNGNGNGHGNGNGNGPRSEAYRMLTQGESVIFNNKYVSVLGVSFNGLVSVKSTDGWSTITSGIQRESLIITSGCSVDLCVTDSVINVSSAKYVKVAGLAYNDTFATISTDGWNTLTSNIVRENLAETKGCLTSRYGQICVGNQVINTSNRYMKVIGVQVTGKVVLQSTDGWNSITTNVDPTNLVITR